MMMKEITYSFIIPHHNTPNLLQRLVDSIPQREDIEIIIVDDNSDINQKANVNRPDVKTIFIDKDHTKGAGRARNIGMDAASGKWLLFADSDDFYKPCFIDVLDEYKDDDIEILFYNVEDVDSETLQPGDIDRTRIERKIISLYDGTPSSVFNLLYGAWGPWRKMIRKEFVRSHRIYYEENPKGNDVLFTFLTSYFVKKWKVDRRVLYVLTYRKGSLTYGAFNKERYSTTLLNMSRRAEFLKYVGGPDWNKSFIRKRNSQSCLHYILGLCKHHPLLGLRVLHYYVSNYAKIKKASGYYIDVVKDIESMVRRREILKINQIL